MPPASTLSAPAAPAGRSAPPIPPPDRSALLGDLARRVQAIEGASRPTGSVCATGVPALDGWLPGGGFRAGTLTDCVLGGRGIGGWTLALAWIQRLLGPHGTCAVIDPDGTFHPAPTARWGWPLTRTVVVRPKTRADLLWAAEQALACDALRAVVVGCDEVGDRAFRRWQLAAGSGQTLGFLLRPARRAGGASWADLRLHLSPAPRSSMGGATDEMGLPADVAVRRLRLTMLYARGAACCDPLNIEVNDETGVLSVVPAMADPAASSSQRSHETVGPDDLRSDARRRRAAS